MTSLPVILVSAKSEAAAAHIISELLAGEEEVAGAEEGARVWRIHNKYYTAAVALRPAPDHAPPPPPPGVDDAYPHGHIVYLTEDECSAGDGGVGAAERRARAGAAAGVRVLAADAARLPAALAAWAARARLHPAALRAPDEGAAGVRAALHAHVWPGLQRAGAHAADEDAGSALEVERWAAALGALAPAAAAARALHGAERLAAAESVLAAFCRALGEDLDSL